MIEFACYGAETDPDPIPDPNGFWATKEEEGEDLFWVARNASSLNLFRISNNLFSSSSCS